MPGRKSPTERRPEPLHQWPLVWPVAALVVPLALYASTFCRYAYWGDSTELALVARAAGVAHPTGYPLWSLLASLFVLPGWEPAAAVNFLSSLFGAGACLGVYGLLRQLENGRPLALFGALSLAVSSEMWLQSSVAEVYALHGLLLTLVLLAALRFYRRPEPGRLALLMLMVGLSLANHMTSVLLLAPAALLVSAGMRRGGGVALSPGSWLRGAAFLLPGLLTYLYIPLRSMADPWPDYGNPEIWSGFSWLVAGDQFRYLMFSSGAAYAVEQFQAFLVQLPGQFTPWLLVPGLLGAVFIWCRRQWRVPAVALLLYVLLVLFHAVNYRIDDKEPYYIPVYVVLAVWIGLGGRLLLEQAAARLPGRLVPVLGALLLIVLLMVQGVAGFCFYTRAVIGSAESGALVICGDFNVYSAYLYGSMVRGEFADHDCILDYLFTFPWYLEQLSRIAPDVVVPPEALAAARRDWNREDGEVRGLDHCRQKEGVLIEIKRLIIAANLHHRPVYLHLRDDTTMKESWAGIYSLEYRGLSYRVVTGGRPPAPRPIFRADYPTFDRQPGHRWCPPHTYQLAAAHKFSDAANRLGVILASAGRVDQALETFNRALAYDPENFGVLRNRGLLRLELVGDLAGGRADFSSYLDGWRRSGEPSNREIEAIEAFLRRLPPPGTKTGP